MSNINVDEDEVYRFVLNQIDSVPHLEALLLLWNSRPRQWTEQELGAKLFLGREQTMCIMQDLASRELIEIASNKRQCWYESMRGDKDHVIAAVEATYRRNLVQLSQTIHFKASAGREFARLFKPKKESE